MPNPRLTPDQLVQANALLNDIRQKLKALSGDDKLLLFAFRRKITKELNYDERAKPSHRNKIKALKRKEQNNLCTVCSKPLPDKDCVLDRFVAAEGYTVENTRLIHRECDLIIQHERGYT